MTSTSGNGIAKTISVFVALAAVARADDAVTWGNLTGQISSSRVPATGACVEISRTRQTACADSLGKFRIPGIPLGTWEGEDFDIDIFFREATARATGVHVPPGALNSPYLRFDFTHPGDTSFVFDPNAHDTLHALGSSPQPAPAPRISEAAPRSVFATREGLVGLTTANGHKIVENDHFAALPSRRGLNLSDSSAFQEFEVEVAYGTKNVRLPVWDVGPWNTKDDWWNLPAFRQSGEGLPRWTPWAEAAFVSGYNGGKDQSGRVVKNPAGIDLGDGAFRQDLGMTDNGLVGVRMSWVLDGTPGQRVRAKQRAKVRETPGGPVIDTAPCAIKGRLLAGPDTATTMETVGGKRLTHWYLFYQVQWDDGTRTGWSAETFLDPDTNIACTEEVRPTFRRAQLARIVGNRLILDPVTSPTEIVVSSADGSILMRRRIREFNGPLDLPEAKAIQFVAIRSGNARQILTRLP